MTGGGGPEAVTPGAFGGSLAPGVRPALLIVDFVRAYLLKDSPLYAGVESVRDACEALLRTCRSAGLPVIHTNVVYSPGGVDGGVFFRKVPALRCFERGVRPDMAAFAEGLEPVPGEVVVSKQYASAFFGTSLAATLTSLRVDTVLIAGLSTSGCVRASAVDCCQHGFIPIVVREAVGDRTPASHEASLFDLQAKYAEVMPLAAAEQYVESVGSSLPGRHATGTTETDCPAPFGAPQCSTNTVDG